MDISAIEKWFTAYAEGFRLSEPARQANNDLKALHTLDVHHNAREIASREGFDDRQRALSEAAALLHDAGRFPQYRDYGTFLDRISVNHGELGSRVIKNLGPQFGFAKSDWDAVVEAVRYHNAFGVPALQDPAALTALRVVRDADKLDVWRIFVEYFKAPAEERASAVAVELPDLPQVSPEVMEVLRKGGSIVPIARLKTLADMRLMLVSWVYDLNFKATYAMLAERGHMEELIAGLPARGGDLESALDKAVGYMSRKAAGL